MTPQTTNSSFQRPNYKLYTDVPSAWDAMLDACEQARHSIDLEQFIFASDEIGRRFIDVCARKAKEGVTVRFLWDSAGSWSLFATFTADELRRKGIDLVFFNTLVPHLRDIPRYRFWFFRNHRRSLIIDGNDPASAIAFTGSVSMTERVRHWRETQIRLTGDVVQEINRGFITLWDHATSYRKRPPNITAPYAKTRSWRLTPSSTSTNKVANSKPIATDGINYITNSPKIRERYLYHQIVNAIRKAQQRIYITTPYFAPTHRILRILRTASRRGVDVRIILPINSDHPIVDLCGRSYFSTLLKAGIRIYLYNKNHMLHTKSIVIDNNWATVGTLNLDTISLLYNYEANIVTTRMDLVSELVEHFNVDMGHSAAVDPIAWHKRSALSKILQFLARLVREFL